jgi:hypothetical protein
MTIAMMRSEFLKGNILVAVKNGDGSNLWSQQAGQQGVVVKVHQELWSGAELMDLGAASYDEGEDVQEAVTVFSMIFSNPYIPLSGPILTPQGFDVNPVYEESEYVGDVPAAFTFNFGVDITGLRWFGIQSSGQLEVFYTPTTGGDIVSAGIIPDVYSQTDEFTGSVYIYPCMNFSGPGMYLLISIEISGPSPERSLRLFRLSLDAPEELGDTNLGITLGTGAAEYSYFQGLCFNQEKDLCVLALRNSAAVSKQYWLFKIDRTTGDVQFGFPQSIGVTGLALSVSSGSLQFYDGHLYCLVDDNGTQKIGRFSVDQLGPSSVEWLFEPVNEYQFSGFSVSTTNGDVMVVEGDRAELYNGSTVIELPCNEFDSSDPFFVGRQGMQEDMSTIPFFYNDANGFSWYVAGVFFEDIGLTPPASATPYTKGGFRIYDDAGGVANDFIIGYVAPTAYVVSADPSYIGWVDEEVTLTLTDGNGDPYQPPDTLLPGEIIEIYGGAPDGVTREYEIQLSGTIVSIDGDEIVVQPTEYVDDPSNSIAYFGPCNWRIPTTWRYNAYNFDAFGLNVAHLAEYDTPEVEEE